MTEALKIDMKSKEYFEKFEKEIEKLDYKPLRNLTRVFATEFATYSGFVEGIDVFAGDSHDKVKEYETKEIDSDWERAYCSLASFGCLVGGCVGLPKRMKQVYERVKK